MKNTTKLRALALSLAMALGMMFPVKAFTQSDDFFRSNEFANYDINGTSRDNFNLWLGINWGNTITNQNFGEAPVGTGLLILTALGAGYAISKRKKISKLFLAMALLLGLSQCNKKVDQVAQEVADGMVTLTLDVGESNDDGSKYDVSTISGAVKYSSGDVLYVASEGVYLGTMSYTDGGQFEGTINTPTEDKPIWFFFFGDKTPNESLAQGTSTSCTVTISGQTSSLPVVSCAASNENYIDGNTSYSAKLLNKCALVKFSTNVVSSTVNVGGMMTVANVDFSGSVTPIESGTVSFRTDGSGEGWAILFPQDAVDGAATTASGYGNGTCNVPEITNNMFYTTGVDISLTKLDMRFSVSAGTKVLFAPGNLWATNKTANQSAGWIWSFAPTQYSAIGSAVSNTAVNSNTVTIAGSVDLFGWVGNGSTTLAAYGINKSKSTAAYGNANDILKTDWCVAANAARLGNHNDWRTLTKDEWGYLLTTRTGAAQKYGHGSINGVYGLIILPDAWVLPTGLSFTPGNSAWANSYTIFQWEQMENNGAVFLPAAGSRAGTKVNSFNQMGCYWSSTSNESNRSQSYRIHFYSNNMMEQYNSRRSNGHSVRLVRVVD